MWFSIYREGVTCHILGSLRCVRCLGLIISQGLYDVHVMHTYADYRKICLKEKSSAKFCLGCFIPFFDNVKK